MSISNHSPSAVPPLLSDKWEQVELLAATNDDYEGVIIEMSDPMDSGAFLASLKASISNWRPQGRRGIWLKLPIELANLDQPVVQGKRGIWLKLPIELANLVQPVVQGGNTLSARKPFPHWPSMIILSKSSAYCSWARRLIAHGLIQSVDPNLVVHRKAAGSGNLKIALIEVVDPTCQLWLSDGFHDNIGEVGVGGFVIWPEHSVEVMNG